MGRWWYLARGRQVYGPIPDPQLWQWAATGHVYPTDQLAVAGQPYWWPAAAVPGLLPPGWAAPPAAPNPFADLETPAEAQERLHRRAGDAAGSFDPRTVSDAVRATRALTDLFGDWLGDG